MRRAPALLAALALLAAAAAGRAQDETSPHRNTTMCGVCHNKDMSLLMSKTETCALCHADTTHSGASEHLRASPAAVARVAPAKGGKATLPLTDDGRIWCGTCHLYHDASIDPWLTDGWLPPASGLPLAVRDGIAARAERTMRAYGEEKPGVTFASKGTRALRLPVDDGSLCRHCHGSVP